VSGSRELLAAFSALCGLTLLTFSARGTLRGKRRSSSRSLALGLYGLLFVLTGIVLWTRGEPPRISDAMSRRPEVQATEPAPPLDSGRTEDQRSSLMESHAFASTALSDTLAFHPLPERRLTAGELESSVLTRAEGRGSRVGNKPSAGKGMIAASPDEQVSAAVLQAFNAIERWFMRHGSPSPAGEAGSAAETAVDGPVELPVVMFLEDTAELTPQGARRLKELAGRLRSKPDSGVVEIHAHAAAPDPTPFHFILTQARAEVVRDFLMKEGVRNYRLIAKAMSSESEDSTMAKPQVRLVFRP